jgi:hypothetical protein
MAVGADGGEGLGKVIARESAVEEVPRFLRREANVVHILFKFAPFLRISLIADLMI